MSYQFYNATASQYEWEYQQARLQLKKQEAYQNLDNQGKFYSEADFYNLFYNNLPIGYESWGCAEGFGVWLYERFKNFHFLNSAIAGDQLIALREEVVEMLENSIDNFLDNYVYNRLKGFSEFIAQNDALYSSPKNLGLTVELPEIDYLQVIQTGRSTAITVI